MQIIQPQLFKELANISYGFTTSSHNLAFHVGDDEKKVKNNHQLLANTLKYDKNKLVYMKQIHSNIVHTLDDLDNFENPPTCDALITNKLNTPIMVMVADCSPMLFVDTKQKAIAVAHAGRAGAFNNIVRNVVQSFKTTYNSNPKDIFVSIGSSIGVCCYKVGREIYYEAKELGLEYAITKKEDSYYLDVSKILKKQLSDVGILNENIEFSDECSCCSPNMFSYRRDGVTGRFCGLLTNLPATNIK